MTIFIKDTGYWDTTNSANRRDTGNGQITLTERVGTGGWMAIPVTSMNYSSKAILSSNPTPLRETWSLNKVQNIGYENPEIKVEGLVTGTDTASRILIGEIARLDKTKGYKILSCSTVASVVVDGTTTDYTDNFVPWLKYDTVGGMSTYNGFIDNVSIDGTAGNNGTRFSFTFKETA